MKAAVLNAFTGVFDIEEIEIDEPRGREVLIEVRAAGLCHSDLHMAEANFGTPLPAVFGHEFAGIVRKLGPDVQDFAPGMHIVGSLIQSCGHCRACDAERTYQCLAPHETIRSAFEPPRLTRNGAAVTSCFGTAAFAEYTLVHENQLAEVPKTMPFPQASLLGCGIITGVGAALNTAKVQYGDRVAVVGAGGVGLNVVSGARIAGAEQIIVVDPQPGKRALATRFGATHQIDPADGDPVERVKILSEGGVDHVFEVVGLEATSQQSMKMIRRGGSVNIIGVHNPGCALHVDPLRDLTIGQMVLQGVYMGSSNIKTDIPAYADLYLAGRLNIDDLVSREIALDEINEAYAELKRGGIARSVITAF